jgi:hypothetical protein|tara:strand:- start:1665 stop:2378 length:714 start_codon:yes stop_codon:yes gene_type:complete
MSDAAFREQVFQQGVVVENLKDKDGKPAGISVTWGDLHYWANPMRAGLVLCGAIMFGLMGIVFVGSTPQGQSNPMAFVFFFIAAPFLIQAVRMFARRANERQHDTLRTLIIRPTGRLEVPRGLPKEPNVRWLYAKFADVTGIELSPAREWDSLAEGSYIILQTVSGTPVFLGQPQRPGGGKAELQPIVVALHRAWEAMRPTVEAHMALEAAKAAIDSGATSIVVGDGSAKPGGGGWD